MQNDCVNCPEIKIFSATLNALNENHKILTAKVELNANRIQVLEREQGIMEKDVKHILGIVSEIKVALKEQIDNKTDSFRDFLVEIAKIVVISGVIGGFLYAAVSGVL